MNKTLKSVIYSLIAAVFVIGAISGYFIWDHARKEASLNETLETLTLKADESLLDIEYGDSFDPASVLTSHEGDMKISGTVDPKTPGDQTFTVTLSKEDQFHQTAEKEFTFTAHVKDTKKPEIRFTEESFVFETGSTFTAAANVESVSDPVDGELEQAETLDKGKWIIEDDLVLDQAGEYTVTVKAMDRNGNESSASYTVTITDPVPDFGLIAGSPEYPYYIRINRALNTVTVYALDDDNYYTIPYMAFVCSTGDATPLGTYNTTAKYRWLSLFGNVYGQYATRIVGHILFHSVPYFTQDPADLEYEEYNKLGTAASMGCIRLCVRDVLWIYENCPVGTAVELYDDYDSPGPLGKPDSIIIDVNDERRGWDPTDPDPNNPW